MSLSPTASSAEVSTCSESHAPITTDATGVASEGGNGDDNGERSVRIPTTAKNTSSLDHESIEGLMVVHLKKKQRQRFLLSKSTHYVVANSMKHALEIYNNDRTELVYLLSLADAVLSFESDNANIVMEKCFCVEVRTWKKKNTVRLQPQGFIFFEENQARMLLWVKCIHMGIKRATTLDSELFRSPSTPSSVELPWRFSDSDDMRAAVAAAASGDDRMSASYATTPGSSPTSSSGFVAARGKLTHRLVIDPAARIVTAGRTMLTPKTRSSSESGEQQPSAVKRWSFLFSQDKQLQTRSPRSSTATDAASSPVESNPASPKPSPWKRSAKATTYVSSETASTVESVSSSRPRSFRAMSPTAVAGLSNTVAVAPSVKSSARTEEYDEVNHSAVDAKPDPNEPSRFESSQNYSSLELADDPEPVSIYALTAMLGVAAIAGVSDASAFLPLAFAGALAHFYNEHQSFSSWTLTSAVVYLASTCNVLFGIATASIFVYMWGYANFKTQRRRRLQRRAFAAFRDPQASHASPEITHFEVPNWIRHPDVDRVEWLNKIFATGWPYLKTAIENSVIGSLNPVLDAQKPAFMSSLSLVRLDLGSKAPQISSVKFVSANTLTDEVTLDVEVRVVTDKKSFIADIKMVSHLGAAVSISLRELLLVGTVRITLNPLAKYWPCFRGLNLSFTTRPFFDFSLTAAKINIANVPFVSEWLHTFLFDLLIDYFVWPNVVDMPLWDEHGAPVQ